MVGTERMSTIFLVVVNLSKGCEWIYPYLESICFNTHFPVSDKSFLSSQF